MPIALITVGIIALLFLVVLILRRYRDRPNELKFWVDATTILIGVASFVVSVVSISVMLSQEKTQEILLEAQMKEHQPVFSINYSLSTSANYDAVNDVEDFEIENIGEQMLSPAAISHKTFIKVDYTNVAKNIQKTVYYPLQNYYNVTLSSDDQTGRLLRSFGNEYIHNNQKLFELHLAAMEYMNGNDKEYVFVDKVDLFSISYIDIYNKERTVYFRDNHYVTENTYDAIFQNAKDTYGDVVFTKSITEVAIADLLAPFVGR